MTYHSGTAALLDKLRGIGFLPKEEAKGAVQPHDSNWEEFLADFVPPESAPKVTDRRGGNSVEDRLERMERMLGQLLANKESE